MEKKAVYFSTPKKLQCDCVDCFFLWMLHTSILSIRGWYVITYRSCTCDLCGPLLASSRESCSSSDWVKLRLEKFSSTIVQSPSTIELVSVRSVAEPMLHSSPIKNTQKHKGKKKLLTLVRLRISELLPIKTDKLMLYSVPELLQAYCPSCFSILVTLDGRTTVVGIQSFFYPIKTIQENYYR